MIYKKFFAFAPEGQTLVQRWLAVLEGEIASLKQNFCTLLSNSVRDPRYIAILKIFQPVRKLISQPQLIFGLPTACRMGKLFTRAFIVTPQKGVIFFDPRRVLLEHKLSENHANRPTLGTISSSLPADCCSLSSKFSSFLERRIEKVFQTNQRL